jgi:serine beta-lactamase-like protein LACTB
MNKLVVTCLVFAGACAHGRTDSAPPAPVSAALQRYVADYFSPTDTLYVREAEGQLEAVRKGAAQPLRRVAGDTFALAGARLVLGAEQLLINGVPLRKRVVEAGTFRIKPQKPVAELRAAALAASPPAQPDTLLPVDLVELQSLDPGIKYDIRYATTNNFMGAVFYSSARAPLQRPAAEAVVRAHRKLKDRGYGLLIFDAYRPWYVTRMFWDATPDSLRDFVADPAVGSRHNRGAAVDLTLYDLATGQPVEMPSGYDEFSDRAHPNYPGGTGRQRWHRELLRRVMEAEGFTVYDVEWWHFDYQNWRRYPVR